MPQSHITTNRHSNPIVTKPLVLVGLMGVGKTTIGKRLAARLGWSFVDADQEIERAASLTVREIFERYGEPYFRDGESRVISRLIDKGRTVIATGGGAFMHPRTRQLILERALAIWIDADIDVLVTRVSKRDTRPLLIGRDPEEVLRDLAASRNPIYAQAQIRVKTGPVSPDIIVNRILGALPND